MSIAEIELNGDHYTLTESAGYAGNRPLLAFATDMLVSNINAAAAASKFLLTGFREPVASSPTYDHHLRHQRDLCCCGSPGFRDFSFAAVSVAGELTLEYTCRKCGVTKICYSPELTCCSAGGLITSLSAEQSLKVVSDIIGEFRNQTPGAFRESITSKKLAEVSKVCRAPFVLDERPLLFFDSHGLLRSSFILVTDKCVYVSTGKVAKALRWREIWCAGLVEDIQGPCWLTINGARWLHLNPHTELLGHLRELARTIRNIAILHNPRISDCILPQECSINDNSGQKGIVIWERKFLKAPPGASWFKRIFPRYAPINVGSVHTEVELRSIAGSGSEVRLPDGLPSLLRQEITEGFLNAWYAVAASTNPSTRRSSANPMVLDITILEYCDPGFVEASLDPFHGIVFRFEALFFEHECATPFAKCFVSRKATKFGLAAIIVDVWLGNEMRDLIRQAALDLGKSCRANGL